MYDREKELWIELIEEFRNLPVLWNQKNKDYTNKTMRTEATEFLLKYYKKIDKEATAYSMKKRLENMRTTFNRERKKASQTPGYVPSLWYYEHFAFLDEALDANKRKEIVFNFNTSKDKINSEKKSADSTPVKRSLKRRARDSDEESSPRKREGNVGYISINVEPLQSAEEEEEVECTKITPPPPKRRIYDLLRKQERFIDTASKIITRKEQEWEVIGKSIGLQLMGLDSTQRTIANKLISDTIFFGSMGKLTLDSFVNVDSDRETPEPIEEHLDEDFEDIKDEITYVDV